MADNTKEEKQARPATMFEKASVGGLGGLLIGAAALGPLGIIPGLIAGGYVGAKGPDGLADLAKGTYHIISKAMKGALDLGIKTAEVYYAHQIKKEELALEREGLAKGVCRTIPERRRPTNKGLEALAEEPRLTYSKKELEESERFLKGNREAYDEIKGVTTPTERMIFYLLEKPEKTEREKKHVEREVKKVRDYLLRKFPQPENKIDINAMDPGEVIYTYFLTRKDRKTPPVKDTPEKSAGLPNQSFGIEEDTLSENTDRSSERMSSPIPINHETPSEDLSESTDTEDKPKEDYKIFSEPPRRVPRNTRDIPQEEREPISGEEAIRRNRECIAQSRELQEDNQRILKNLQEGDRRANQETLRPAPLSYAPQKLQEAREYFQRGIPLNDYNRLYGNYTPEQLITAYEFVSTLDKTTSLKTPTPKREGNIIPLKDSEEPEDPSSI